jgi:hypothetical protein
MIHEPRSNVTFLSDLESARPSALLAHLDPALLVGHYVKRAFAARRTQRLEHMWVLVERVLQGGILEGVLDNDPVLDVGLACGDSVQVHPSTIEAIYRGPGGGR